jgi:DNA-binding NarL/FixJ family response regulator
VIIEDDPSYCSMMELILNMEGFDVRIAPGGQSGLDLVREKRPDLILCDIMMPGMDGHSVLEVLKDDKTLDDIPFIFVTALGERQQVRSGMSAGADDYLPKPFSADELLSAVTGRIRRHEMIKAHKDKSTIHKEQSFLSHKITRREREVLLMVGQGATSKEIAERLGVCPKTIEVHRANLMRKLDVTNVAGLTRWAVKTEQMPSDSE